MARIRVSCSAVAPAPPELVYGTIADYHTGHATILPPRFFSGLVVEQGGVGAGTRIRFEMHAFGNNQTLHAEISEPEPGRVLVETYPETGAVTTFTVESLAGGAQSRVTITTEYWKEGLSGWALALFAPRFLRTVYIEELELISRIRAR